MKVIKNLIKYPTIVLLSVIIFSCSGEDGANGPQGEQGNQGLQGDQGSQGAPGDPGDPGTANVIYSDWFNTEFGNNIVTSSSSFTTAAPEINAGILNFGTILVYGRRVDLITGNQVYQIPIVFGAARQQSYYFRATDGQIRISVVANEQGQSVGDGAFFVQYRYVIIPGGQNTSGKSTTDYKNMSYEEVADLFNIQ